MLAICDLEVLTAQREINRESMTARLAISPAQSTHVLMFMASIDAMRAIEKANCTLDFVVTANNSNIMVSRRTTRNRQTKLWIGDIFGNQGSRCC